MTEATTAAIAADRGPLIRKLTERQGALVLHSIGINVVSLLNSGPLIKYFSPLSGGSVWK